MKPVYPGDTLRSTSQVIGLKQNSNGKSGVVWVRTKGMNQNDEVVLDYIRWVMVRKRDLDAPAPPDTLIPPDLKPALAAEDLVIPPEGWISAATISPWRANATAGGAIMSWARRSTMSTASRSRKPNT